MQVVRSRQLLALVSLLVLAPAGCRCGEGAVRLLDAKKPDFGVEVRDAVSCEGLPVRLHAVAYGGKAPYQYTWTPADGLDDPQSDSPLASRPGEIRTYEVTVTDAQGYRVTGTARVTPRAAPTPRLAFARGAAQICGGDGVELDASASRDADGQPVALYRWEQNGALLREGVEATSGALSLSQTSQVQLFVQDDVGCTAALEQTITVRPLPTVELSFAQGAARLCAGDTIRIEATARDADGAPPTAFAWDLDGNAQTVESTTSSTGPYLPTYETAALTVTDAFGCRARALQTLDIGALPSAAMRFVQGAPDSCEGSLVELAADGSRDASGAPVARYAWDLDGDPATIEGSAPHAPVFAARGARTVRVTVEDARGCRATAAQTVDARSLPKPVLAFTNGGKKACAGDEVALTAAASRDADGAPVAAFAWDLDGDGRTDVTTASTAPFVPRPGVDVRLSVADAHGCVAEAAQRFDLRALPTPVVDFAQGRASVCLGDAVALSAARSTDADGKPVASYAWDLDGNGAIDSTARTTAPFSPAAPMTPRLTVTDAQGCRASTTTQITPRALPTARFTFQTGSSRICAGDSVALDGSSSRDSDGNPVASYAWELDGVAATMESTQASTGSFQPESGAFRLTVTDALGCRASASGAIDVGALPVPRIRFAQGNAQVCRGQQVVLDGSASTGTSAITQYAWDFDADGTTDASGPSATLTPSGPSQAQLTIVDARGCRASSSQALSVRELPQPAISFLQGGPLVCDGDAVILDGSGSRDADGASVASYRWDTDGRPATSEFSGATAGPFEPVSAPALLTVADAAGCAATEATQVLTGLPRSVYPFDGGVSQVGVRKPVDIIFVIDNSGSMGDEIMGVQSSINVDFASIIQASNVDYRVLMISKHGDASRNLICVSSPLSGTTCNPLPKRPVNTSRFFHYSTAVGSTDSLDVLLATYRTPDANNFAPNGWSQWLRPDAVKLFVEVTDDDATMQAGAFDASLLALDPAQFGTAEKRNYVWYSIVGLAQNAPVTAPWDASAPLQTARCTGGAVANAGLEYQRLSILTGGLRFPLCELTHFDAVFQRIAQGVIDQARVDCSFKLPASGPELATLEVEYTPGSGGTPAAFRQVPDLSSCVPEAFYLTSSSLMLCPDTCTLVQADPAAKLSLTGCSRF